MGVESREWELGVGSWVSCPDISGQILNLKSDTNGKTIQALIAVQY